MPREFSTSRLATLQNSWEPVPGKGWWFAKKAPCQTLKVRLASLTPTDLAKSLHANWQDEQFRAFLIILKIKLPAVPNF
jgi:hypothetical protein